MSFNIPSEREESDVLREHERIQRQLDDRFERMDNPFGLTVDPDLHVLCVPPPPLVEGQVVRWRKFTEAGRHGKVERADTYVAYRIDDKLVWGYPPTQ